ncbi:MAG: nuclear transport factor 2 family protein [Acidimicrobiales bacterium]
MIEPSSEELAAKDAIRDVVMRYCRGVDRLDVELLKTCYHSDSYDDHGHFKGNGHDFAEFIVESLPKRTHHSTHSVGNVLIELDVNNPDRATAESYSLAYLRRTADDGTEWLDFFSGRYVDRFEKREGDWRIAHRVVVHDWSASASLDGTSFPLPMDTFIQGLRGRSDLIYLEEEI